MRYWPASVEFLREPKTPEGSLSLNVLTIDKVETSGALVEARFVPSKEVVAAFLDYYRKSSGGVLFRLLLQKAMSHEQAQRVLRNAIYGAGDSLVVREQLRKGDEIALVGEMEDAFIQLVATHLSSVREKAIARGLARRLYREMVEQLKGNKYCLPLSIIYLRGGVAHVHSLLPAQRFFESAPDAPSDDGIEVHFMDGMAA